MFGRLLWKLLRGSRGRLIVAFVAIVSGAAVISAILNLQGDVESRMNEQFRLLGANIIISSGQSQMSGSGAPNGADAYVSPSLIDQKSVMDQIQQRGNEKLVAAAPFLDLVAHVNGTSAVTAGTWLDQLPKLDPTWKIEGAPVTSREDAEDCLVGRKAAQQLHLAPGSDVELNYMGEFVRARVAGVIDAGGTEDSQIFVSLSVAQKLARSPGQIQLVQLSIAGNATSISKYASVLQSNLPGYDVQPIPQVTQAEGDLMNRIRLLITGTVALILVLTALCVLATMTALAMERREDVGLMKALGGSISRIVGLFLAEVGVIGAVGGFVGCVAGLMLSRWMGERVFAAAISPHWRVLPLTVALMVGASLTGALPLHRLGKIRPAVILRGE